MGIRDQPEAVMLSWVSVEPRPGRGGSVHGQDYSEREAGIDRLRGTFLQRSEHARRPGRRKGRRSQALHVSA